MRIIDFCMLVFLLSCNVNKSEKLIIIKGEIDGLSTDTIYLTDAYSSKKMDSSLVTNGMFSFKIFPENDFEPYLVSLKFYSKDKKEVVMAFKNKLRIPQTGTTAFMLEKGTTKISGNLSTISFNSTNHLDIECENETKVQFLYESINFGNLSNNDSSAREKSIYSNSEIIKKYPYSHFLIRKLFESKNKYSSKELEFLISFFNKEMRNGKYFNGIVKYIKYRLIPDKPVESFVLESMNSDRRSIIDSNAKLNMVTFWASWCGPCIQEIPSIRELYEKYKNRGVKISGISLDKSSLAWESAVKKYNLDWDQFIVDSSTIDRIKYSFDFSSIPVTFFVDRNGNIIQRVDDYFETNKNTFIAVIENFLRQNVQ